MNEDKHSVDECSEMLRIRGWNFKESAVNDPNRPAYWRVNCASGGKTFAILAPVRSDAWNQAVKAVLRFERDR